MEAPYGGLEPIGKSMVDFQLTLSKYNSNAIVALGSDYILVHCFSTSLDTEAQGQIRSMKTIRA